MFVIAILKRVLLGVGSVISIEGEYLAITANFIANGRAHLRVDVDPQSSWPGGSKLGQQFGIVNQLGLNFNHGRRGRYDREAPRALPADETAKGNAARAAPRADND